MKDKLFLQAAGKSDTTTLTAMLEKGFDINYVTEWTGFSVLHFAARESNLTVIEFLLEVAEKYKLNINIKNRAGRTPLYSAVMLACNTKDKEVYDKSLEIIAMLLNAGANCLMKDNDGMTALRCAELMDSRKVIFNLLKANCKPASQQSNISSGDEKEEEEADQHNENLLPENIASSATRQTLANQQGKKPGFWIIVDRIYDLLPSNPFSSTADAPSYSKLKKD